jgi:hypothetical protein
VKLCEIIERARLAQQQHDKRIDVQLEFPDQLQEIYNRTHTEVSEILDQGKGNDNG